MSYVDDLIRALEESEKIDPDFEEMLAEVEFVRLGDEFVAEIIGQLESLADDAQSTPIESIELFESGDIKAIHFHTPQEEPS